jgi:hypothetical protein
MDILANSQDYDTMLAPFLPESTTPTKARTKKSPVKRPARATIAKNRSRNSKRPVPPPAPPPPPPPVLEELNTHEEASLRPIDAATPLIHIPFETLGLMALHWEKHRQKHQENHTRAHPETSVP